MPSLPLVQVDGWERERERMRDGSFACSLVLPLSHTLPHFTEDMPEQSETEKHPKKSNSPPTSTSSSSSSSSSSTESDPRSISSAPRSLVHSKTAPHSSSSSLSSMKEAKSDMRSAHNAQFRSHPGGKKAEVEEEEEEEEEESEYEKQLIERIRLLQNELRKCISAEEAHEKEKQELLSSLEKERQTSSSLKAANDSLSLSLTTLQVQMKEREESFEQAQKENTFLKNKIKKMRRDKQDDMSGGGRGGDGKSAERLEKESSDLKNEVSELKRERDAILHFMFTPEEDDEEGFIPPFEHRVERVGWMLKESEILKEWRRRLFVMRGKGNIFVRFAPSFSSMESFSLSFSFSHSLRSHRCVALVHIL